MRFLSSLAWMALAVLLALSGCANEEEAAVEEYAGWVPIEEAAPAEGTEPEAAEAAEEAAQAQEAVSEEAAEETAADETGQEQTAEGVTGTEEVSAAQAPAEETAAAEAADPAPEEPVTQETPAEPEPAHAQEVPAPAGSGAGKIIVLDPGHTAIMTGLKEPVGPGATELKDADTMGTAGVASGLTEYELNLTVCQKLREELRARGYEVYMTREGHNLSISCVERAEVANAYNAAAFIRVHADGSTDSSAKGAMTICITPSNAFHPELYAESRRLSDDLIEEYCKVTGARSRGVWETDSMTGNNWSKVPVTLIELGFMTNPDEDLLMATEDYQAKMVIGIANGIDRYISGR